MWLRTVTSERKSRSAICRVARPSLSRSRVSHSRAESSAVRAACDLHPVDLAAVEPVYEPRDERARQRGLAREHALERKG